MKLKTLTNNEFLDMLTTIERPKTMNARKEITELLRKEKCDPDFASPNFVADFAWKRGYQNLSSDDIVWISDNYEG